MLCGFHERQSHELEIDDDMHSNNETEHEIGRECDCVENEESCMSDTSTNESCSTMSEHGGLGCNIENNLTELFNLRQELCNWAIDCQIPHQHINKLLHILHHFHSDLPLDARTLLHTPNDYLVVPIGMEGEYCHLGLGKALLALSSRSQIVADADKIDLQINVDGVPLSKSSDSHMWPILAKVIYPAVSEVFAVGVYHGKSKPTSFNMFLSEFVEEVKHMISVGGVELEPGHFIPINIKNFICDTPARADAKSVRHFNFHFGCDKCKQEGEYIEHRMTFQFKEVGDLLRKDEDFQGVNAHDLDDYVVGNSVLAELNIGMVSQFPLDYMHVVCLGVVKKIVTSWKTAGKKSKCRVSKDKVLLICERQEICANFIPGEFQRRCRTVLYADRWKATECRQFLLYLAPVVLYNIIDDSLYCHFMKLSTAVSLLCSSTSCQEPSVIAYSKWLLLEFVREYAELYGREQMSYNVHALLHIVNDVELFGSLDNFSAFCFENYLGKLKRVVRKPGKTVQQVARRVHEMNSHVKRTIDNNHDVFIGKHDNGPIIAECASCLQYKKVYWHGRLVTINDADNCFQVGSNLCRVVNILKNTATGSCFVLYKSFGSIQNFFTMPLPSDRLGIHVVSDVGATIYVSPLTELGRKYMCLPLQACQGKFVVIPLLHDN